MNSEIIVILTDDYEIFGNGSGDLDYCLLKPTEKLLALCGKHNVPVTLFADVAEFWAFETEENKKTLPESYMPATKMRNQLINAVKSGHDVQLHLHPQWLNYRYDHGSGWQVDTDLWRLPSLPYGDIDNRKSILGALFQAKKTLEDMLKPYHPDYECIAFRGGAMSIQPEKKIISALIQIGIKIDSTVAPGLFYDDRLTRYDFREHSAIFREQPYWYTGDDCLGCSGDGKGLLEAPVCTTPFFMHEKVINKIIKRRLGLHNTPPSCSGVILSGQRQETGVQRESLISIVKKKIKNQIITDFTISSANEMYSAVKKAMRQYRNVKKIPLVFISHSKVLGDENLRELEKFIIKAKDRDVVFGTFKDILEWEKDVGVIAGCPD